MRKNMFRILLLSAAMSLCLILSASVAFGQCGADGMQPCGNTPKPSPKQKVKSNPKNVVRSKSFKGKTNLPSAVAYNYRGGGKLYNGENDAAIEDFTKAIELNPQFAEAYFNRGIAYLRKKNYDAALENYAKAIDLNLSDPSIYYSRAYIYDAIGQKDLADKDRRKYYELTKK